MSWLSTAPAHVGHMETLCWRAAAVDAMKAAAKSKAAKKNEKRKAKKASEDPVAAAASDMSSMRRGILPCLQLVLSLFASCWHDLGALTRLILACSRLADRHNGHGAAAAAAPSMPMPPSSAAAPEEEASAAGGPAGAAEKLLRGITKKLRQCEALQERRAQGEALTRPELDKLSKVPGW